MTVGDIENIKSALENWDSIATYRDKFVEKNQDEDGGEPLCGYEEWDAAITDYNYDLASAGEDLAEAIREVLT